MLPLSEYFPYLLNRAGTRIAAAFSEVVRAHGISLQMWRVLAALHQQEGQRIGSIADLTAIEISTLSRVLDSLQRRKLIERRRDRADARSITVHRTAAGRELTLKLIPTALEYETVALAGFSSGEAAALKKMLVRVYQNMDALGAKEPRRKTG